MNKLLRFCFINLAIFSSSSSLFSQGYVPFPENYAVWTVYYSYGPDNTQNRFHIYTADGDTTINSISYNKLYLRSTTITAVLDIDTNLGGPNYFITPGTTTYPRTYQFAYRNDVANKMVYKVPEGSITEQFWYNFNLQIGDTVPDHMINPQGGSYEMTVSDIDTVFSCGYNRLKYFVSPSPCAWMQDFHIIEGIGNDHIFTLPECAHGEYSGHWLQCFVDYDHCGPNSPYDPCNLTVGIEELEDETIGFYPNPATDQITLTETFDEGSIINSVGQTCIQFRQSPIVQVQNLTPGIYAILASRKGKLYHAHFIKQ